jgi:SAM-dependent methyltransferase
MPRERDVERVRDEMSDVQGHYRSLLAPIYSWMVGGAESAFERGAEELRGLGLLTDDLGYVVDLGAGFGMHAVPLARLGKKVLAIDSSAELLSELAHHASGLPVATVAGDLLAFPSHLEESPSAILCMGDTLTHLADDSAVEALIGRASEALTRDGVLVLTFRDYGSLPTGDGRFVNVRGGESRIHTCFLEEEGERVRVHDIVHERTGEGWEMRVSSYLKLRLRPEQVSRLMAGAGFAVETGVGMSGMVRLMGARV